MTTQHIPAITIEHLSYAYPVYDKGEPVRVLQDLSLSVEKGEFVALTGPTGAGKTTLCLALAGLIPLSAGGTFDGAVLLYGQDTTTSTPSEISRTVGSVFQDPESQLFSMTVASEIAFPLESRGLGRTEMEKRIHEALVLVGLTGFENRSPLSLSGGQMQRVAIAAMIASRPDIMVLDEPASGLDPIGKQEVYEAIRRLKDEKKATIILVEQDAECIAAFADRLLVLQEGHLVADDTPRHIYEDRKRCLELDIDIPPMVELAWHINKLEPSRSYQFVTEEEAEALLCPEGERL